MKKVLKITGISVAVIFLLLLILPFVFKGKIVEQVKIAINENVNAVVDFDSFSLSFIRNFPNISFRMKGLTVVGVDQFEGDTLAAVKSFSVSVNLVSLFGSDGYEIKTISIDQPNLLLKVLKDGTVNWDITIPSEVLDEPVPDEEPFDFKIALRKLQVKNANIVYDDAEMDLRARIRNMNHTLRGDFTADFTTMKIRNTTIESLFVTYEGFPYLYNVFVDFTADIDADLNEFLFTFRDNTLKMNELLAEFEGTFAMPDDAMIMDFVFASPQADFKAFLSMIPAIYAKDFEGLRTSGTLEFNGHVKGVYDDNNIPGFGLNIKVENGMLQYPDLPAAITDVFINTTINNPGGDADYTVVDVSRFNLNVAGSPVEFKLNLRTPVSDPNIDAILKGRLDLSKVKDFYPLDEGETLQGMISSDMVARGRLSSIENERYNEFLFEGQFAMSNFVYKSNDFPQGVEIAEMNMRFSPQFVQLSSFSSKIGDSDLSATGRIDNLLGFALSDQLLTGSFATQSRFFDLNQFMEEPDESPDDEPFELSVIEIPANIDFTLRSTFNKMLFSDLEITNVNGIIRIVDQTASLQNLQMNMLDGTMVLNGSYSSQDIKQPSIDFDLNISQFDIQKTFNTFNTFQTIAPIGERAHGRFSASFGLKSILDEKLDPVLSSLAGGGSLQSSAIRIENSPALVGLADNLQDEYVQGTECKRHQPISFEFMDGRVEVKPFDMNFGNSTATIQGHHGFDQSINYVMSMTIPRAEFGGAANEALNGLVNQAAGRGINITPGATVNVGAAITGTVSEPRISLSLAQTAGDLRDQVMDALRDAVQERTQEVREQVEDVIDDARERVSEELERRAQQVDLLKLKDKQKI
jgi:hypothetical protein